MRRMCRVALAAAALGLVPAAARAQDPGDPEARLAQLGLALPPPNRPAGNYVSAVRTGNLVFLAAHGECGVRSMTGKLGAGVTVDSARASAQRVALCLLSTLKAELGDLRRVQRIVRVGGLVNGTPDFAEQPRVIDGCSDLLVAVFGERGRHARAASGVSSLAGNRTVSIEMVVEVRD